MTDPLSEEDAAWRVRALSQEAVASLFIETGDEPSGRWSAVFGLPEAAPAWYTGRLWLLRVGDYKLTRPKEQATDWGWIMEHTIQLGARKCLVILGGGASRHCRSRA